MRLNGWQRIGIVLAAIWIPIGFFWGNSEGIHRGDWATLSYRTCVENSRGDVERGKCEADFERSYTESIQGHWFDGA
jgi:hypothetical protein